MRTSPCVGGRGCHDHSCPTHHSSHIGIRVTELRKHYYFCICTDTPQSSRGLVNGVWGLRSLSSSDDGSFHFICGFHLSMSSPLVLLRGGTCVMRRRCPKNSLSSSRSITRRISSSLSNSATLHHHTETHMRHTRDEHAETSKTDASRGHLDQTVQLRHHLSCRLW